MGTPNLSDVFLAALETATSADRTALLDEASRSQPGIRPRVERMLEAQSRLGDFLQSPALGGDPADGNSDLSFLAPSDRPGWLGRLGHYAIEEVIGCGGFGVVFKGCDEKLRRTVAIKTLAESLAASATARARFVREAQAAAAVNHEHVVRIYAVEDSGPVPYFVMEHIAGVSLDEKMRRDGPLPLNEVLRIGIEMASGLAAAHAQGLVHRDVKPGNILLEEGTGRVKITDFGLARAVDDATISREGLIAGTPEYMSPEQSRGVGVDQRSDLFSLGSVLYAMCTGRSPFAAEGSLAVLKRICETTPLSIRTINPEIPEWFDKLITRLHAKNPDERVGSAAEVAESLRRQRSMSPRISRRRRRWILATAALCMLALAGYLAASPATRWLKNQGRIKSEPTDIHRRDILQSVKDVRPGFVGQLGSFQIDHQVAAVTLSPDGQTVAIGTAGRLRDGAAVWDGACPIVLFDLKSTRESRRLTGHRNSVRTLAFAPDGTRLVSASNDRNIKVWDTTTGLEVSSLDVGNFHGLAISPDGGCVLVGGGDRIVRLFDLATGNVLWRCGEHPQPVGTVALSSDGRRAATGGEERWDNDLRKRIPGSDHSLRLWDLQAGTQIRRLRGHTDFVWSVAFSPDGRRAVSGSHDKTVRLWDLETGDQIYCFQEHQAVVRAVAFAPDGRRALSGGGDKKVRLLDLDTGEEVYCFQGHEDAIRCIVFSPDGRTALSGDGDGTVLHWQLPASKANQLPTPGP